jgi:hypothetical protein
LTDGDAGVLDPPGHLQEPHDYVAGVAQVVELEPEVIEVLQTTATFSCDITRAVSRGAEPPAMYSI